jgi:hypothetical protein
VCGAMEVRRVLVVGGGQAAASAAWLARADIFRILKLLGRLRTMKPFGPLAAPLITSNHLRGE